METRNNCKARIIIYVAIAYGITFLMGFLMWYGSGKGYDLSVFPTAQMLYPAAGVILGLFVTNKGRQKLPKGYFITCLTVTAIQLVLAVVSIAAPLKDIELAGTSISAYNMISQYILIGGSIIAFIFLLAAGKDKRGNVGLTWKNGKSSVKIIAIFLLIYLARILISTVASDVMAGSGLQDTKEWLSIFGNPYVWINIVMLPLNFFFVFLAFFGEEYGWRYYLQPLLQKKFGLRGGVILLGVVWGIWHIPVDMFYYTQSSGIQMIFAQQITCISLGIFFAYAYMKTQNIWVPVCLHYLNNNLVPIITATFSADVLENQEVRWGDLPAALLVNGLCFGLFLLSGVFKKKRQDDINCIP